MRLIDADALTQKLGITDMDCCKCEWYSKAYRRCNRGCDFEDVCTAIDDAPTIEPDSKWIPCSERMPEEHEWLGTKKFGTTISDDVYVTFESQKGERFCKHITFQNGELSRYDKAFMEAWYEDSKPIAWMPLPEPYQEVK
jgi:hypothetical protein